MGKNIVDFNLHNNMNTMERKFNVLTVLDDLQNSLVEIYDQDSECFSYNENLDDPNSFDEKVYDLLSELIIKIKKTKWR